MPSHRLRSLLLSFLIFLAGPALGQKYRTAVGARLGKSELGLTVTQRLANRSTLEVLGTASSNDLTATALFRQHQGFLGHALNFYFGLGPHIGDNQERGTFYGGTLVFGTEWKIPIFPVVLAYDWMPSLSAHRAQRFNNSTAISIRYVILKEKKEGFFKRLFGGKKDEKKA